MHQSLFQERLRVILEKMDEKDFVLKLLEKMEAAKPEIPSSEQLLTPEFMEKHTKFSSFKEMVQLAIKEAGILENYIEKLKSSL